MNPEEILAIIRAFFAAIVKIFAAITGKEEPTTAPDANA